MTYAEAIAALQGMSAQLVTAEHPNVFEQIIAAIHAEGQRHLRMRGISDSRMRYIEDYLQRMESHAQTQVDLSGNSPSWIGYHNAMTQIIDELERYDAARSDAHES